MADFNFCPNCGAKKIDNASFCVACGRKLTTEGKSYLAQALIGALALTAMVFVIIKFGIDTSPAPPVPTADEHANHVDEERRGAWVPRVGSHPRIKPAQHRAGLGGGLAWLVRRLRHGYVFSAISGLENRNPTWPGLRCRRLLCVTEISGCPQAR